MTKAQRVRDLLKTGTFSIHEIHAAHPDIPEPNIRMYVWKEEKDGKAVRSGTRGEFRWTSSGGASVEAAPVEGGAGGESGADAESEAR